MVRNFPSNYLTLSIPSQDVINSIAPSLSIGGFSGLPISAALSAGAPLLTGLANAPNPANLIPAGLNQTTLLLLLVKLIVAASTGNVAELVPLVAYLGPLLQANGESLTGLISHVLPFLGGSVAGAGGALANLGALGAGGLGALGALKPVADALGNLGGAAGALGSLGDLAGGLGIFKDGA
jgi:hypothetical protein